MRKSRLSKLGRRSDPGGHYHAGVPQRGLTGHKHLLSRAWLGLLGLALLVLLVAQGWLFVAGHKSGQPAQQQAVTLSSSSSSSSGHAAAVDTGHLALLDTLWGALPFTHVVRHHIQVSPSQEGTAAGAAATPAVPTAQDADAESQPQQELPPAANTSNNSNTSAPTELPRLANPNNPELSLAYRLAAAAVSGGFTAGQARKAFLAAFQAVPPPRGFPAWQARLPPTPEAVAAAEAAQQHQHKGAEYVTTEEEESDTDAGSSITAADLVKGRPKGRTLGDEAAIAAAAAAATAWLARASNSASTPGAAPEAAQHLMTHALVLLKASHKLALCAADDASLPIDKLTGVPGAPRVLLAVTEPAGGAAEAWPNLVLQLLQFVLQSQPGSLYISIANDSSSSHRESSPTSSSSSYWIDMLQLLMAPLQVPVVIVQGDPTEQQQQSLWGRHSNEDPQVLARNAAIQPFFSGKSRSSSCAAGDAADAPVMSTPGEGNVQTTTTTTSSSSSSESAAAGGQGEAVESAASTLSTSAPTGSSSSGSNAQGWRSYLWPEQRAGRSLLSRGSASFDFLPSLSAPAEAPSATATAAQADTSSSSTSVSPTIADESSQAFGPTAAQLGSLKQPQHISPECFNPDWVVFVEASSFFCKSDLQRVLLHTDADMACGMDMHVAEPSPDPASAAAAAAASAAGAAVLSAAETVTKLRRQLLQQQQLQRHLLSESASSGGGSHTTHPPYTQQRDLLQLQLQSQTAAALPEVWHERPPALDIWKHPVIFAGASVGRMVNGLPFSAAPYYAAMHPPTLRRLVAGLPTQVYCCWSGLTKLSAEPFKRDLRFRSQPQKGECSSASSQNLMCDDLHRTGFNKVLMDSGVLLTHDLNVSAKFTGLIKAAERAPFIRRSRWVEVQGSGSPWEVADASSWQQAYKSIQCCDSPALQQRPAQSSRLRYRAQWHHHQQSSQQQQSLLIVDEMVQAAAAGGRPGQPPLPLRGWDASDCRPMDIVATNHTHVYFTTHDV